MSKDESILSYYIKNMHIDMRVSIVSVFDKKSKIGLQKFQFSEPVNIYDNKYSLLPLFGSKTL